MLAAVERAAPDEDHATQISYAYAKAGRRNRSSEWAKKAHQRQPTAITAYNLSCDAKGEEKEKLLRDSLARDPNLAIALLVLGRILDSRKDPEGRSMLERCVAQYEKQLNNHYITKDGCRNLITAAKMIGKRQVIERTKARLESLSDSSTQVFDEENLAVSINHSQRLTRE